MATVEGCWSFATPVPVSSCVSGVCRKGMDLYFKRHDGQAVTCDDFLAAMADANGQDLSTVARWSASHPLLVVTLSSA